MSYTVSILVCTRNRAESLACTLHALGTLQIPDGCKAELIVVDNGSTDNTPAILRDACVSNMTLGTLREEQPGQCRSYNRGIAAATGDILLFTDDDVRPPVDWIEKMTAPILRGDADAVAGGVRMAPHLCRPWIEDVHRDWLACSEGAGPKPIISLVGANMALSRGVFEKVPGFDPEMGPGAIGHASDTLFSIQLQEAGFRIVAISNAVVEHHFQPDRLTRRAFQHQAAKRGEYNAYIAHHWHHVHFRLPRVRALREWLRLQWGRLSRFPDWMAHQSVPVWELHLLESFHTFRSYLKERRRPRNYDRRGLIKRNHQAHS